MADQDDQQGQGAGKPRRRRRRRGAAAPNPESHGQAGSPATGEGRASSPATGEGRAATPPTGGGRQGAKASAAPRTGGGGGGSGTRQGAGRRRDGGQVRARAGGDATPAARPRPHALRLEVGGHGMELHCDTCDLVVTHLAEPQVRRFVEEAHRSHQGELTWESAWVAVCSCGWRSGRVGQQAARDELDAHIESFLRAAASGRPLG